MKVQVKKPRLESNEMLWQDLKGTVCKNFAVTSGEEALCKQMNTRIFEQFYVVR